MTDYFQSIDKNIKTLVVQIGQNVKSNQDQKKNLDILTKKAQEQAEKDEKNQKNIDKNLEKLKKYAQTAEKKADEGKKGRSALEKQVISTQKYIKNANILLEQGGANLKREVIRELGFSRFESIMIQWGDRVREWKEGIKQSVKERIQRWKDSSKLYQIGKNFWEKESTQKFMAGMVRVAQGIGRHVREVLGPVAEVIDWALDAVKTTYNFIKGAVSSVWDAITMRRKEDREKRMAKNIAKMREGIEYLVKGERVSKISKKAGKKGIFEKLGDLLAPGGGGLVSALLRSMGGLGPLLLRFGLIGALGYMIGNALKAWIRVIKGGGGLDEASIEGAVALTSLPRKLLGWIGDALLSWLGINFKPSKYLSDDAFREQLSVTNKAIQNLIDATIGWWYKLRDWWQDKIDWIAEKLGLETTNVRLRKVREATAMVQTTGITSAEQATEIVRHRANLGAKLRELSDKRGPEAEKERKELRDTLRDLDWSIKDLPKQQQELYNQAMKAAAESMASIGLNRNDVAGQSIPESINDPATMQNLAILDLQGN